ncbi:MAG: glycosyltransferase, partial [Steroidobacteraceae bacterium]
LAGDGQMRNQIQDLISHYDLTDRVRITGWISGKQVRDEILAARALVLPTFAEGLPVVIMEAMALQRPIISTFIAGIPELVLPGKHGWLVPAGDVNALVQAIEECLDTSPELIALMGNAARERVLARHDVDIAAAKLAKLFSAASR